MGTYLVGGSIGLLLGLLIGYWLGMKVVTWVISLEVSGGLDMLRGGLRWRSILRGIGEETGAVGQGGASPEESETYGELDEDSMVMPPGVME